MDVLDHIEIIKQKLAQLRQLDQHLQIFSATSHGYILRPCLTDHQLSSFEMEYEVSLPVGYRAFLQHIGNGGAGPYYGLWSLQESIQDRQECLAGDRLFLAQSFPPWRALLTEECGITRLSEFWQKCEEDFAYLEQVQTELSQWDPCQEVRGSLPICEYGSGMVLVLVVSGTDAGEIWFDNRSFPFGLMPTVDQLDQPALDFLTWYERWLDESIAEFQ